MFFRDGSDKRGSNVRVVPLLPLRDIIVFPHMVVPLFVGREKSRNALEEAISQDKGIFLSAQKKAKTNDPAPDDLFTVGTLGTIVQLLRLPDKTLKVSFTPALGTEHVLVRTLEPESGIKIETGDYLLTDRGYYIGVMTSDTECYVVPSALPDRTRRTMIPVTKPVNEVYYKAFAEGLIKVRQMIKGDQGRAAVAPGKSG